MATLYLRNVSDEVMDRLKRLAERDGGSVSAVAVRELAEATRTIDNAGLLDALPELAIDRRAILDALDEARAQR